MSKNTGSKSGSKIIKTEIELTASVQHGVKKNNKCPLLKHKSTENWWQVTEFKQGKLNSSRVLWVQKLMARLKKTSFSISLPVFTIFLILFTRRSLSTLLILAVCRTRVTCGPSDDPVQRCVLVAQG